MKPEPPIHSPATAAPKRSPFSFWWVLCGMAAVPMLSLGLLAVGVAGCFRLGSDARALRDSVAKAGAAQLSRKVELSVGRLTLSLARAGLSFADLDPVARTAINTVQGAEVGVYELGRHELPLHYGGVLEAADKVMAVRGLERVVGVTSHTEVVGVYVPAVLPRGRLRVCVLVLDGKQLVVASVRGNVEPLLALAMRQAQSRCAKL